MARKRYKPEGIADGSRRSPHTRWSAFSLAGSKSCPPHEVAERRHDPVGRFLREKVPAVLELMQLMVRQRGLLSFELLPSERDVLQAPEKQRRLVGEGRAVVPDRAQPVASAHDVTGQRSHRGPRVGRRLRVSVMRHDFRRQDASIPHRFRHHRVHEHVAVPDQVLADPARHQEAERPEVEVVAHRPAPAIRAAQFAKRRHGLAIAASRQALGDGWSPSSMR